MTGKQRAMELPWSALPQPMTTRQRALVARATRALLGWQATLGEFPRIAGVPRATPFVALYARGRLCGCFGSREGRRGEPLARAFLLALHDPRYGGVRPGERAELVAHVSYLSAPHEVSIAELRRRFELGTDGVAVLSDWGATLLLPSVAVDERVDARGMLALAARKLGLPESRLGRARLVTFRTEDVTVRSGQTHWPRTQPGSAAVSWLASRVNARGRVAFGVDARAHTELEQGPFLHGRAAVVVQALAVRGGPARIVDRARRWLVGEVRAALEGHPPPGWPENPAEGAGTVALAVRAGLDFEGDLLAIAKDPRVEHNVWHAAQVAAALGPRTPRRLWSACAADLESSPWAPWTAIAARALDDRATLRRAERALCRSIRRVPPHAGSVDVSATGEVALTALTVEALSGASSPTARTAVAAARDYLLAHQFLGNRVPAPLDPQLAQGAWPVSVVLDGLRADVTAHSLLALGSDMSPRRDRHH